jgi:hypothetical protein
MWYRASGKSDKARVDFEIREYVDGDGVVQVRFWSRTKAGKAFLEEHCAEFKLMSLPNGKGFVDFICDEAGKEKLNYTTIRD